MRKTFVKMMSYVYFSRNLEKINCGIAAYCVRWLGFALKLHVQYLFKGVRVRVKYLFVFNYF